MRRKCITLVSGTTLPKLLLVYLATDLVCIAAEWWITKHCHRLLPDWGTFDLPGFIKDITSYLIMSQIEILGIIAVAVGIVTLLSQGDEGSSATTDVRLYYSESLTYEVVTSGVALSVILFVQLFWPGQFILHRVQGHGQDATFELGHRSLAKNPRGGTFELCFE